MSESITRTSVKTVVSSKSAYDQAVNSALKQIENAYRDREVSIVSIDLSIIPIGWDYGYTLTGPNQFPVTTNRSVENETWIAQIVYQFDEVIED